MSGIFRASVYVLSCIAFFGYNFLLHYYEFFGLRIQDINTPSEHFLTRGIEVFLRNSSMAVMLAVSVLLLFFVSARFRIRLKGRRIHPRLIAIPMIGILLMVMYANISGVAAEFGKRDLFAKTTSLRQLVCLRTESELAQQWFDEKVQQNSRQLILLLTDREIVVFSEPPHLGIQSPHITPRVELTRVGLMGSEIISHEVSGINPFLSPDGPC